MNRILHGGTGSPSGFQRVDDEGDNDVAVVAASPSSNRKSKKSSKSRRGNSSSSSKMQQQQQLPVDLLPSSSQRQPPQKSALRSSISVPAEAKKRTSTSSTSSSIATGTTTDLYNSESYSSGSLNASGMGLSNWAALAASNGGGSNSSSGITSSAASAAAAAAAAAGPAILSPRPPPPNTDDAKSIATGASDAASYYTAGTNTTWGGTVGGGSVISTATTSANNSGVVFKSRHIKGALCDIILEGTMGVKVLVAKYPLAAANDKLKQLLYDEQQQPTSNHQQSNNNNNKYPVVYLGDYSLVAIEGLQEFVNTHGQLSQTLHASLGMDRIVRIAAELSSLAHAYDYRDLEKALCANVHEMLLCTPSLACALYDDCKSKSIYPERPTGPSLLEQQAVQVIKESKNKSPLGKGLKHLTRTSRMHRLIDALELDAQDLIVVLQQWIHLFPKDDEKLHYAVEELSRLKLDEVPETLMTLPIMQVVRLRQHQEKLEGSSPATAGMMIGAMTPPPPSHRRSVSGGAAESVASSHNSSSGRTRRSSKSNQNDARSVSSGNHSSNKGVGGGIRGLSILQTPRRQAHHQQPYQQRNDDDLMSYHSSHTGGGGGGSRFLGVGGGGPRNSASSYASMSDDTSLMTRNSAHSAAGRLQHMLPSPGGRSFMMTPSTVTATPITPQGGSPGDEGSSISWSVSPAVNSKRRGSKKDKRRAKSAPRGGGMRGGPNMEMDPNKHGHSLSAPSSANNSGTMHMAPPSNRADWHASMPSLPFMGSPMVVGVPGKPKGGGGHGRSRSLSRGRARSIGDDNGSISNSNNNNDDWSMTAVLRTPFQSGGPGGGQQHRRSLTRPSGGAVRRGSEDWDGDGNSVTSSATGATGAGTVASGLSIGRRSSRGRHRSRSRTRRHHGVAVREEDLPGEPFEIPSHVSFEEPSYQLHWEKDGPSWVQKEIFPEVRLLLQYFPNEVTTVPPPVATTSGTGMTGGQVQTRM